MKIVRSSLGYAPLAFIVAFGASGCAVSTDAQSPDGEVAGATGSAIVYRRIYADSVSLGDDNNGCIVFSNGSVRCFTPDGSNGVTTATPYALTTIALETGASVAVSGNRYSCALLWDDTVWCWGTNPYLGASNGVPSQVMTATGPLLATSIAGSDSHACVTTPAGGVACWGTNVIGELGIPSPTPKYATTTAVSVPGVTGAVSVAAGGSHSCALLGDGGVSCWGGNQQGQLGNLTTSSTPTTPGLVQFLPTAKAIAAGEYTTCAITDNGEYCWGGNEYGQLGIGANPSTTPYVTRPMPLHFAYATSSLGLGYFASCQVANDVGYCQGNNFFDSLGNALTTNPSPIELFGAGDPVSQMANGIASTCAVTTTGHVECVGLGSAQVTMVF